MMSVPPTPEPRGLFFQVWRFTARPVLALLFRTVPGALGLRPPATLEAYNLPAYRRWWSFYLFWSLRQVIGRSRGEIVAVGHAFLALTFTGLTAYAGYFPDLSSTARLGAPIGFVLIVGWLYVLAIFYMAYAALRAATPEEYALAAMANKSESDVLRVLAYEMLVACWEFRNNASAAQAAIEARRGLPPTGHAFPAGFLQNLEARYTEKAKSTNDALPRLRALVDFGAEMLHVSPHRLCDHVLKYRPETHHYLSEKYSGHLRGVARDLQRSDYASAAHRIERCCEIRDDFDRRAHHLDLLFRCAYLHPFIHRISSRHSTSGALKEYARALDAFATDALDRLRTGKSLATAAHAQLSEILRLLHRTQQAYPGFDIHQLCLRLCQLAALTGTASEVLAAQVLSEMHHKPKTFQFGHIPGSSVLDEIQALKGVINTVERLVDEGRSDIRKKFLIHWTRWLAGARPGCTQLIIFTHGYSKTVRHALEGILTAQTIHPGLRVMVMSSSDQDPEDARRMVYELRSRVIDDRRQLISDGDEDVVLDLLDKQSSDLLVVVGAECFDGNKRVIHPRGARDKLEKLHAHPKHPEVWVVAETYKHHRGNLLDALPFFRYHLGDQDIYPPALITQVIPSDTPPLPVESSAAKL